MKLHDKSLYHRSVATRNKILFTLFCYVSKINIIAIYMKLFYAIINNLLIYKNNRIIINFAGSRGESIKILHKNIYLIESIKNSANK